MKTNRYILGLDPGLADFGYAILHEYESRAVMIVCGSWRTPADAEMGIRLQFIYEKLQILLKEYKPALAGIEKIFFKKNISSGITVAHARGVCILGLCQKNIPIFEMTPAEVKNTVAGSGNADKFQMSKAVQSQLHLPSIPRPDDAVDAAAVALATLYATRLSRRISLANIA